MRMEYEYEEIPVKLPPPSRITFQQSFTFTFQREIFEYLLSRITFVTSITDDNERSKSVKIRLDGCDRELIA